MPVWKRPSKRVAATAVLLGVPLVFVLLATLVRHDADSASLSGDSQDSFTNNFGQVVSGRTLVHNFEFRNPTTERLVLPQEDDIQRSCGCTRVTVSSREVQLGGSVTIAVTVATAGKRGFLREQATINWVTGSGALQPARVVVEAELLPAVQVTPNRLVFDRTIANESKSPTLTVDFQSPLQVDWTAASAYVDTTSFVIEDVTRSASGLKCRVAFRPEGDDERIDGTLILRAGGRDPANSEAVEIHHRVDLTGTQDVVLAVSPRVLLLSADDSGLATAHLFLRGSAVRLHPDDLVAWAPAEAPYRLVSNKCSQHGEGRSFLTVQVQFPQDVTPGRQPPLEVLAGGEEAASVPIIFHPALRPVRCDSSSQ
jgi:hypothetical protein